MDVVELQSRRLGKTGEPRLFGGDDYLYPTTSQSRSVYHGYLAGLRSIMAGPGDADDLVFSDLSCMSFLSFVRFLCLGCVIEARLFTVYYSLRL